MTRTSSERGFVQGFNNHTASPAYSPFRRDERDLRINEEDALLLEGEPCPLTILVEVEIEN